MTEQTPDRAAELDELPTAELYDRAMGLAKERKDVGFLWRLLKSIPAAAAAGGDVGRAEFDLLHAASLLEEFTHADEGKVGEALRPLYIEYLAEHEADAS
ncbi:hypothetical protein [Actinomadura hibisca]|uniref:hypothetical protein n=1 Tax=Actinomadura hibisca TaxID=68565 RepID=UPI000833F083|nr:hypothetical protein [Actinomadura hibisca]